MAKSTRPGVRLPNGTVLISGGEGGLRRMRCPKCQMLATETTRDGQPVVKCPGCGTAYTSTRMTP